MCHFQQYEGLYCYLLDENGFVVAGNDGEVSSFVYDCLLVQVVPNNHSVRFHDLYCSWNY